MKFIGQLIQDFVARFRNDVYLEDIDTGTIVSGGNLGLDSNNKVVKNTVGGGGTTDLTSDVTGILPVANGGTGQNSLGSVNISDLNNDSGFTTNTGDITSVAIADGVNTRTVSSGSATINFVGGEGVDLSSSALGANDVQLTISGEDASTSNKGIANFSPDNFSVSSGAVTIKSGGVDLTDEVTGTLPVANGGTGLTSLSTLQNSNVPVVIHQFMGYLASFVDGNYYYGHTLYGPYHHSWNGKVSSEPTDMADLGAARHSHFMHIVPTDLTNISIKGACQGGNTAISTIKFHLYKTTRSNSIGSGNSTLTKLGVATTDTIDNINHLFNCDLTTTDSISAGEALVLLVQPNGTSNAFRWNYTLFGYAS
jgi:hypothetical protein